MVKMRPRPEGGGAVGQAGNIQDPLRRGGRRAAGGGLTICQEQERRGRSEKGGSGEQKQSVASFLNNTSITPRARGKGGKKGGKEGSPYSPYLTCRLCANNRCIEISVNLVQLCSPSVPGRLPCLLLEGQFVYRVASSIRRSGGRGRMDGGIIISPLSIVGDFAPLLRRRRRHCHARCLGCVLSFAFSLRAKRTVITLETVVPHKERGLPAPLIAW